MVSQEPIRGILTLKKDLESSTNTAKFLAECLNLLFNPLIKTLHLRLILFKLIFTDEKKSFH
jgi:hypothetical protein